MKFITIAIICIYVIGINCEKNKSLKATFNPKCDNKTRIKIDRSIATVFPVLNGVKLPENEKQLRKYCTSVSNNMDLTLGYVKNCLGNFGPTIAKFMVTPFSNEFNSICKNEQLTDRAHDLLRAGDCINKATNELTKCGESMIDALMAMQLASDKDRILMSCCHANVFRQCFKRVTSKTKGCDQQSIDTIQKFGFDRMGTTLSSFCGEYFTKTEKCNKIIDITPKLNPKTYIRPKSIFLPIISLIESFQNVKCDKRTEKRMDQVFADLLTVGSDKPLPENAVQLREYCSHITQNLGFVFGYVDNCISDFGKLIAKIMIFPLQKQFVSICKHGKLSYKASEILKGAACGNKAKDKLKICMDRQIDAMVGIAVAPVRDRIFMACCHANALRQCFRDATESTEGCSKHTIDLTEKMVMDSFGSSVSLVCGEYFGSNEKCDKLIAETPKMDSKTYVRPKSFFLPGIALLESFPDFNIN